MPSNDDTTLYTYSTSGVLSSPAGGYTGGGFISNSSIAFSSVFDGAGTAWTPLISFVADPAGAFHVAATTHSGTAFTPAAGLGLPYGEQEQFQAMAPDLSGNLWIVDGDGSLIEFVGLSTPVATPLLYNRLGKRP